MHPQSIRRAAPEEYEAVAAFYDRLIDDMAGLPYHPKWQKGIYPEYAYLKQSLERGQLHIALCGGRIVAAMIANNDANDGYAGVVWPTAAKNSEVTVIHALGVAVSHMGRGLGKAMVRYAIDLACRAGCKALRLDVIDGNLPARRLYTTLGFGYVTSLKLYYEDTGWCDFDLFEYPLTER